MKPDTFNFHGALAPLEEACSLAKDDVQYVSDLMKVDASAIGWVRKATIAKGHLRLLGIVRKLSSEKYILIREFSNVPLLGLFPLIRGKRDRLFFLVNHNFQWTIGSRLERIAFRGLGRLGCRFVFFEQVPEPLLEKYRISPDSCFAWPHPVPKTVVKRTRTGALKVVGVIGQFRPEKGIDELLEQLEPLAKTYRIVLALPNLDDFVAKSRFASADWIEQVDTRSANDYLTAIAQCDVVVLNHPTAGYEYRASGLIADAAAAQVPVVVRNLPVLRHQIQQPVSIGECFDTLSDLPDCFQRVSNQLENGSYDFATYNKARSAKELAQKLNQLCAKPTLI